MRMNIKYTYEIRENQEYNASTCNIFENGEDFSKTAEKSSDFISNKEHDYAS